MFVFGVVLVVYVRFCVRFILRNCVVICDGVLLCGMRMEKCCVSGVGVSECSMSVVFW